MKREVVAALAAAGLCGLSSATAAPAAASPNTGPSTAVGVEPGVPFSGEWSGTPRQHIADCCDYWHFYRPTFGLRTGDSVQLAIDNSRNPGFLRVCLLTPTDEFGATDVLGRECDEGSGASADAGALVRRTLVYRPASPNGLLVAMAFDSHDPTGQYTITIERVITRIDVGLMPPTRIGRRFSLAAALRYGDNTPAADGSTAVLQYRRGRRDSSGPRRFQTIARASSSGGKATFTGQLPRSVGPRLQLRACADQPGGPKPRCTRAYGVTVG